jgi:glucosamine kinase
VALFLGIDGGGSKTTCLLGDEVSVLGRGAGAGSNIVRLGEESAQKSLSHAILQACSAANRNPRQISRTCIGIAGGTSQQVSAAVRKIVSEVVAGEIEIVGDMVIALHAAFGLAPGVIVVAGTGSIAYGRNSDGDTSRAGGWGFAISDEGSGHWIGRAAIAAMLRSYDEGKQTDLLENILNVWCLDRCEQLVLAANAVPGPNFAALFPAIMAAADAGDAIARQVLEQAGRELSGLAKVVIGRLFRQGQTANIAMTGSVLANCEIVREAFSKSLTAQHATAAVGRVIVDPVEGALALARKTEAQ